MPSTVKLNGQTFVLGDTVTFNKKAKSVCYGPTGLTVIIRFIRGDGKNPSVGLYSPDKRVDGWGDLDGEVNDEKGWWISASELAPCIQDLNSKYTISASIEHCGVQLKGKPCVMLAHLDNGLVFVEFEDDVYGCSADGLGKSGCCVAVKTNVLAKSKKQTK